MRASFARAGVGLVAAATLGLGCGRSVVFELFDDVTGTSGGTSGGSTGRGETSGGSIGTASSSGSTGRATGTSAGSSTGGSTGSSTGTSGGFTGTSTGSSTSGSSAGSTAGSTTTGGATTGSSGGSSGGTTGPQCQPPTQQPIQDLPPCSTSADCTCPAACVFDPIYQQQDCEFPCQTSGDCPFIETACASNGFCPPNPCGGSDGSQNGSIDDTCVVAGQGPGSCIPVQAPLGFTVNLCLQGGDTFGSCSLEGERSSPTQDCAAGLVCLPSGNPLCETLCNPLGPTSCGFQEICTQPEPLNPLLGICAPGPGTSGGSSGGGTTSGGSGNGGSSGGQPVCNPAASPVEFVPCTTVANCGCPMVCVSDPLAVEGGRGDVCEYPCQQLSQCPDLLTICNGKNCHLNPCGQGTGNGVYNSFCNVVGVNDGTCIPLQQANGTTYGVCAQGGSAMTACNASADRSELSEDCLAGMVCIGGAIGTGGVCGDACNPDEGGPCPPGQDCAFTVDDPLAGACYTP